MNKKLKNTIILSILFFGPLLFYLFLLTGTNKFKRLPVVTENVREIADFTDSTRFKDHISILSFLGNDLLKHKTNALNLNEKIYKHFYGFRDFQFVVLLPKGTEADAGQLKKELGVTTSIDKWYFIFLEPEQIRSVFNSLNTRMKLDSHLYSPYAFIIDREGSLRGRKDETDPLSTYGYFSETVSPIHKDMVDDVKVIIAEYRLALKKNKRKTR